ncbi:MAG: helix-turn-helix transcriptional regulator [Chloroflexi bacterium]|nr:helix-turn-helix transcriptional regulator [Chloroflexota bacterium]
MDKIAKELEVPQPTVSHHLKILRDTELVQAEKRGRNVFYSLIHHMQLSLAG